MGDRGVYIKWSFYMTIPAIGEHYIILEDEIDSFSHVCLWLFRLSDGCFPGQCGIWFDE